jgi:glycosyltransferase involved in cell wall biosynthesis
MRNIETENISRKSGRWLWAIPMTYREDGAFWDRDGGLVCMGLRTLGVDARFVALGSPGERKDVPLITCTLEQMEDEAWWRQWGVDGVLLSAWGLPQYEPIARAIKAAKLKLTLTLDTQALFPQVWFWGTWRQDTCYQKDSGRCFPSVRALLKTIVNSFRYRHAGTIRHLEHADLIVLPTPLAEARYGRFLQALGRADLISRLRYNPYATVKEMTYDPGIPKKNLILAVARWQSAWKNAPLLVKILERVLSERPEYSARIIGSGSEVVRTLARHMSADCRGRLEIIEHVEHAKLPDFYKESKIFLGTSTFESFMITAAEALCCGCSVVGDGRIASMVYFTGQASGTTSWDSSPSAFRDAVVAEIEAWESGERDAVRISQSWQARMHPECVAGTFLKLMREG